MRIIVIGGGISGLAAAHFAAEAGHDVVCLEPGRPGGLISSHRLEGFLCEAGPQAILDGAPDTVALLASLGLGDRAIHADPVANRRFIFAHGALHRVPTGPLGLLTSGLLPPLSRLRALAEPFIPGRHVLRDDDDETVLAFGRRRIGAKAAEILLRTATIGIFAGDAADLSLSNAFPRLAAMERDHGSLLRGIIASRRNGAKRGQPTSFPDGLGELPTALARTLGARLWPLAATAIEPASKRTWRVDLTAPAGDGRREGRSESDTVTPAGTAGSLPPSLPSSPPTHVEGDVIIVATDAATAARLLSPLAPETRRLTEIPTAPIAICALGFRDAGQHPLGMDTAAYGVLVARGETPRLLGCQYESSTFAGRAPPDSVLVRGILGGVGAGFDPEIVDQPDDVIVARATDDLRQVAGLKRDPDFARVWRHHGGIPQYRPGHLALVAAIDDDMRKRRGLYLIGHALRGVGVNESIRAARRIVHSVAATVEL